MALELHSGAEGVWKKFQMTHFDMPSNVFFMKYVLKSVPGLADVGVAYGDGPRTLAPGYGSKIRAYHVDQCEKSLEAFSI